MSDDFLYTPTMVEMILLAGPTNNIEEVDVVVDVATALTWLRVNEPALYHLVEKTIAGYTLAELAEAYHVSPEGVFVSQRRAYHIMSDWLNCQS